MRETNLTYVVELEARQCSYRPFAVPDPAHLILYVATGDRSVDIRMDRLVVVCVEAEVDP